MFILGCEVDRVAKSWPTSLVIALCLTACSNPFNKKESTTPKEPVTQPDTSQIIKPFLRLSGSNTIGAELAPALVESWLSQKKGASDIRRIPGAKPDEIRLVSIINGHPETVEIKAHGTATGFTELGNGSTDIAMASRKINDKEAASLASLNLGDEKVIGLDAVVVIVHESNGATSMTRQQIKAIFTGQDTSRPWHVNARDKNSGTFDTFKAKILDPDQIVSTAKRFEDSRALAAAVAPDPDGIGFIGLPYAVGVKKLQIQEKGALPVEPSILTVKNESYPLTRRLYFYLPQQASADARQFSDFAISQAGQDVVDKIGFVGQQVIVNKSDPMRPDSARIPGADILSTMLYFRSASYDLDPKATEDLKRIAALIAKQGTKKTIILVGFADNVGDPDYNLTLSKRRARVVSKQLEPLGILDSAVTGFGSAIPIGDNGTDEGRAKNRRVEIWIR